MAALGPMAVDRKHGVEHAEGPTDEPAGVEDNGQRENPRRDVQHQIEDRLEPLADQQQRQRRDENGDEIDHAYAVSLNSSRPISQRRISEVPAPISYSLASRSSRPVG